LAQESKQFWKIAFQASLPSFPLEANVSIFVTSFSLSPTASLSAVILRAIMPRFGELYNILSKNEALKLAAVVTPLFTTLQLQRFGWTISRGQHRYAQILWRQKGCQCFHPLLPRHPSSKECLHIPTITCIYLPNFCFDLRS
jgi:hypothetical protein